jgi:chromosome segregation ATPase
MNATTKEEVQQAAQDINAAWKKVKLGTEVFTTEMINARIGGIIIKSENLKERLDRVLAKMEQNGKNATEIKPLVDEYDAKIKLAKEKYEAAMDKFEEYWQSEDKPEAKDTLEQAKDLMKEAKEALKDANEKLREITKEIKKANGQQELIEETNQTSTT